MIDFSIQFHTNRVHLRPIQLEDLDEIATLTTIQACGPTLLPTYLTEMS